MKPSTFLKASLLSFIVFCMFALNVQPAMAQVEPVKVAYFGREDCAILQALALHKGAELVDDYQQAEVIIVQGKIPEPDGIAAAVEAGAGLLLFLDGTTTDQALSALFGKSVTQTTAEIPLSLTIPEGSTNITATGMVWNSAPQIRARTVLDGLDTEPIVVGFEDNSEILSSLKLGAGEVFIFAACLNDAVNMQIQDWPYFNYLIYHLVERAAGNTPLSFGAYPASPVPQPNQRIVIFVMLGVLLATVLLVFMLVRRYSKAHPETLDALVTDQADYEVRQKKTDWENLGFHRPLSGFLLAFVFQLVLAIPLVVYSTVILPTVILPSAQALGIWGRVSQIFTVLWLVFDMGTSTAFVKFFSEYRTHEPRKAVKYVQFYVWWQAISGAFQVALVTAIASGLLPQTNLAIYAWVVILHSVIQVPGFLSLFRNVLSAWQRFDYTQILDMALTMFFPIITQSVVVVLMVMWGKGNPIFGGSMGGLLGMPIAAYLVEIFTFLLGWRLYRRLGYNVKVLFLAHFDWATVKSALGFGVFMMGGGAAYGLGQAIEIVVTTIFLVNYNEIWGNWQIAQGLAASYAVLLTLNGNLLPSISEAFSNARHILSQYYVSMAYKWGGLISGFFCASLLAVADRFILGASGVEFERAALYVIPLVIYYAFGFPTWTNDVVQQGANRPSINMYLTIGEQVIRISLLVLLIERFQIYALIIAYIIALILKGIVGYFINHKINFPLHLYKWQTFAAPVLAGTVHYLLVRTITGVIWSPNAGSSILIYILGVVLSFPLYSLLYGFFGGWDDNTLNDFKRAVNISNFAKPITWLFWKSSELGSRISFLHGRFPVANFSAAMAEADSLTAERVSVLDIPENK